MGQITDQEKHERDVEVVRAVGVLFPALREHLQHHIRNPFAAIRNDVYLALEQLHEGNLGALRSSLLRIEEAAEHILEDLKEAGL